MKISPLCLLILLLQTHFAFAQFYLVMDKDGYVNVHNDGDSKSKVVDTLNNGHFVYFLEEKGNWREIDYHQDGKDREGFVYKGRLWSIDNYDSIPLRHYDDSTAVCSRDSVKIVVRTQKFDKTKYRFTYSDHHWILKINGKQYWGTDGERPQTEYRSIIIQTGSRKIILPDRAFENLFQPSIFNTEVHYDRLNDIFYIHSQNSDGAGFYDVVWRIVKGIYTDRDIEYGF